MATFGHFVSEETKRKISLTKTGVKYPEGFGKKMSEIAKKFGVGKWMKGRKLSEETKQKMRGRTGELSKRWKGGKAKCLDCGKLLSVHYPTYCITCGHKGSRNPCWRGGVTPESAIIRGGIEYRLWREAVFARDSFTCQKYGTVGGKLRSHHIQNFAQYPELRFAINNGITLSEKAHREFHHKYGIRNNTREQIEEFIKSPERT